jgi:hypothetical protein
MPDGHGRTPAPSPLPPSPESKEKAMPRSALVALAVLTLSSLGGCDRSRSTPARRGSERDAWPVADVAAVAAQWAPPNEGGARFELDGKPKIYAKDAVYELLNGGADAYLDAGLVRLLHARFADRAGQAAACEVMLMDLGSAAKAKGFLAKEAPQGAKPVAVGDQGLATPSSVLFAKGRHLTVVNILPQGDRKWPAPLEIARRVAATSGMRWTE